MCFFIVVSFYIYVCIFSGHQLDCTAHPGHSERRAEQTLQRLHEWAWDSPAAADLRIEQPTPLTPWHLSSERRGV